MASSSVSKVATASTGPKISSRQQAGCAYAVGSAVSLPSSD